MDDAFRIEPLGPQYDRTAFACGVPVLDVYLQRQASQDARRRVAQIFVAVEETAAPTVVVGYYTLSATSFARDDLPTADANRLPGYPVPAAILGRLAVARTRQRLGLGEFLLLDALHRVLRASAILAVHAVIVDAKGEDAACFYARYGFRPFASNALRLFLPLATIAKSGL